MFGISATTAALVGAGAATIGGALINSHSVDKASDQQAASTDKALAANEKQAEQTRADYAPWRAAGVTALGQYAAENDKPLDVSNLQMDPGYQFGLTQGQQAIDRKTAAGGGRISGAALKRRRSTAPTTRRLDTVPRTTVPILRATTAWNDFVRWQDWAPPRRAPPQPPAPPVPQLPTH